MNPASRCPPGLNTRKHSRHTAFTSGTNTLEIGWKIKSKDAEANADRSAISPRTHLSTRLSRFATSRSLLSCSSDRSKLTTSAPAAARTGACCPPPEARQRTVFPGNSASHAAGTDFVGVRITLQTPFRAARMTSGVTGVDQRLPCRDSRPRLPVVLDHVHWGVEHPGSAAARFRV